MNEVSFSVKSPLPKKVPHDHGRWGRPYVPDDVRKWRAKIAKAFLKAGGRAPKDVERVEVFVTFSVTKKHPDLDSAYHSVQDALSKDALGISDNNWTFVVGMTAFLESKKRECTDICVRYMLDKIGA